MKAHILTIGDELLIGQVINTNAAWIGDHLTAAGLIVNRAVTIGDDFETIKRALKRGRKEADVVLITGGLGPTHDDITRDVVSDFFDAPLAFDKALYESVLSLFSQKKRKIPESNKTQAMVPLGFEVIPNKNGTACGFWHETKHKGETKIYIVMPGVPHEMKLMMENFVLPRLHERNGTVVLNKTLLTSGIGESRLAEKLGDYQKYLNEEISLAFLPSPILGVRMRLSASGTNRKKLETQLEQFEIYLRSRVKKYIYGEGNSSLEKELCLFMNEKGLTLSVAESCTGGFIADRCTNIPGSSGFFRGGVVAYCNHVKMKVLGVSKKTLKKVGAVSEETACQMAAGVRALTNSDIGISTTGVAGPTGGSDDKPVGTVWIGFADEHHTFARKYQFVNQRRLNKELSSTMALFIAWRKLNGTLKM